jgi:ABC-2 type transport system permease protein
MLSKLWAITWKELYTTFTDRNLILVMIATPLALATIIGAAFSSFWTGGNDVPVRDIPVAVVNLDAGTEANGTTFNNGAIFVQALVPPTLDNDASAETVATEGNPLYALTNAVQLDDAAAAKAAVDRGEYAAAIIIPADFSAKLTYSQQHSIEPVSVEVYASAASPTSAEIVRSITEGIANQIATGSITIEATIESLIERAQTDPAFALQFGAAAASGGFGAEFADAFTPGSNPVSIEQQTVTGERSTFNPLVMFGAAQAVFFMMFTAMGGANSMLEERRDGTLQRLLVTPTPRIVILLGKLLGTLVTCIVQVTILVLALTLVGSLLSGQLQFIWGSNLLLLAAAIVAVSVAACGLGTILAAAVQNPEQGSALGGIVSMGMGVLGGAFVSIEVFPEFVRSFSRFTINYWGTDAFVRLAQNQTDITTNLLALFGIGIVLFSIGVAVFNRRLSA